MKKISNRHKVDTLIVGAGASGCLVAAKSAGAGRNVLILEAGPERKLEDLFSSQIWARKLKWGGAHVEEEGNLKIGMPLIQVTEPAAALCIISPFGHACTLMILKYETPTA